ncbi:ERF family protein [Acidithiobacillus concretivorus]|uniref:ERF family protein n=1 Tax=Acidithiobacillus concretivorus TaxID=3063952 RepID=A0ABS5ZRC6_9PROT|nr:ERF family protein [Acidithiobacillus concretivorus]MBU2738707.1 ERF family protein [Acidithiobacillus concretivorus]
MENQKLFAALLAAQKSFTAVRKDGKNPMFKSQYATLDSVLDAVRQPLLDAGILLMQPPVDTGERLEKPCATVKTTLIHAESGESMEVVTSIPLAKNDAQGYGSAVTYARRYALMGLLGIAPEDDDGNAASSGNARQQAQRAPQQTQPAATPKKDPPKTGPSLESALEKVKKSPVEKLDFAEQWCRMNFTGDDLKVLEKAITERRSAA